MRSMGCQQEQKVSKMQRAMNEVESSCLPPKCLLPAIISADIFFAKVVSRYFRHKLRQIVFAKFLLTRLNRRRYPP